LLVLSRSRRGVLFWFVFFFWVLVGDCLGVGVSRCPLGFVLWGGGGVLVSEFEVYAAWLMGVSFGIWIWRMGMAL